MTWPCLILEKTPSLKPVLKKKKISKNGKTVKLDLDTFSYDYLNTLNQ